MQPARPRSLTAPCTADRTARRQRFDDALAVVERSAEAAQVPVDEIGEDCTDRPFEILAFVTGIRNFAAKTVVCGFFVFVMVEGTRTQGRSLVQHRILGAHDRASVIGCPATRR